MPTPSASARYTIGGLSKNAANSRGGLSAIQLRRLFDFVEAHIDQPLTIEALAREAGASSSHLRHWFKQATAQPFIDMLCGDVSNGHDSCSCRGC